MSAPLSGRLKQRCFDFFAHTGEGGVFVQARFKDLEIYYISRCFSYSKLRSRVSSVRKKKYLYVMPYYQSQFILKRALKRSVGWAELTG